MKWMEKSVVHLPVRSIKKSKPWVVSSSPYKEFVFSRDKLIYLSNKYSLLYI